MTMLSFPAIANGECKIVEYADHNEVVCEENKTEVKDTVVHTYKDKKIESDDIIMDYANKITLKVIALLSEQIQLIESNAPINNVASKSNNAEKLLSEIDSKCRQINYNDYKPYCIKFKIHTEQTLASMLNNTAKYYASFGNKAEAKKRYRDVVIRFTGDPFRSQVKAAEFGLEDLK